MATQCTYSIYLLTSDLLIVITSNTDKNTDLAVHGHELAIIMTS